METVWFQVDLQIVAEQRERWIGTCPDMEKHWLLSSSWLLVVKKGFDKSLDCVILRQHSFVGGLHTMGIVDLKKEKNPSLLYWSLSLTTSDMIIDHIYFP